jgi:hypothetical protein
LKKTIGSRCHPEEHTQAQIASSPHHTASTFQGGGERPEELPLFRGGAAAAEEEEQEEEEEALLTLALVAARPSASMGCAVNFSAEAGK